MRITVAIITCTAPFSPVIDATAVFTGGNAILDATQYINEKSKAWWDDNDGYYTEASPYKPIHELGYDSAHYELFDGELSFDALIDAKSAAILHEAHYTRKFDDQGLPRPGYLVNAYVAGHKPGGVTSSEMVEYIKQQAVAIVAIEQAYSKGA